MPVPGTVGCEWCMHSLWLLLVNTWPAWQVGWCVFPLLAEIPGTPSVGRTSQGKFLRRSPLRLATVFPFTVPVITLRLAHMNP